MGLARMFFSPRKWVACLTLAAAAGLVLLASKESQYMGNTWNLSAGSFNTNEEARAPATADEMRHRRSGTSLRYDTGLPVNLNQTYNITRLIYNRVGKCGSRSLQYITDILARWNNFNHIKSADFDNKHLTEEEQVRFIEEIEAQPLPYIYNRHVHFVDFTRFHHKQPMFINLVRDPLERVISFYYYKRYGDMLDRTDLAPGSSNDTFEECVVSGMKECSPEATNRMVPYFCGQDEECRTPSRWALETAIKNIIENYVFVGTLEDFDSSLYLLEYIMPQFFSGASDAYKLTQDRGHVRSFRSAYKEEPSEMAKEIMRERLAADYVLYNFIKKRLNTMKRQFGLMPSQWLQL